jgi:hypothetical protein
MTPIEAVTAGPEDATEIFGRKVGRTQINDNVFLQKQLVYPLQSVALSNLIES